MRLCIQRAFCLVGRTEHNQCMGATGCLSSGNIFWGMFSILTNCKVHIPSDRDWVEGEAGERNNKKLEEPRISFKSCVWSSM